MSFLDSLGNTFKSLGGAIAAPVTTAYDLTTTEYDDAMHHGGLSFGDALHVVSHGFGKALDPLSNDKTWTGYSIGKVMDALNYAYKQGVDRPYETLGMVSEQAGAHMDLGNFFDPETWSKAWNISRSQSLGQAYTNLWNDNSNYQTNIDRGLTTVTHQLVNPKTGKLHVVTSTLSPYEQSPFTHQHSFLAGATSTGVDLTASWFLDPGVVAGKTFAGLRQTVLLHQLSDADRLSLLKQMNTPQELTGLRSFIPHPKSIANRVDDSIAYTMGKNVLKRQLTGPEIYSSLKPFLDSGGQGKQIASLWSQTLQSDMSVEDKFNTIRRLLASAGGDQSAILSIQNEIPEAKKITDALANIQKRGVTELTLQELNQDSRISPELLGEAQRQVSNLDDQGEVTNFVKNWIDKKQTEYAGRVKQLQGMSEVGGTMDYVPNAKTSFGPGKYLPGPQSSADKALLRQNSLNTANRIATLFQRSQTGESTLWQKSLDQMPLLVTKAADVVTAPWLKSYAAFDNNLRQVHYIGVANLHDWSGATDQLDSMLRLMGADDPTRLKALDKAFSATTELEKRAAIEHVEQVAMDSFAKKMSAKYKSDIDADYVRNLVMNGQYMRGRTLNSIQGVAYSATSIPADSMLRQAGVNALSNDAQATAQQFSSRVTNGEDWTVDMFDTGSGSPVHLALLESQLANKVPLLDAHTLMRAFKTEESTKRLADLGEAWKTEALDLGHLQGRLARAKGSAADRLSSLIMAKQRSMDALTDAGQALSRAWKYSVLMRLGFPQRVLSDDNARIITQVHAASHYLDNGAEATKAWWYNRAPEFINSGGVKAQAAQRFADTQSRRRELQLEYGFDKPHSDAEFERIVSAAQTFVKKGSSQEAKDAAKIVLDRLDPEGHITEWYQKADELGTMRRSAGAVRGNITRWQGELDAGGDAATLRPKIEKAKADLAHLESGIGFKQQSFDMERTPDMARQELKATNELLIKGEKAFREGRRHIGDADVPLGLPSVNPATGKPWRAHGAFADPSSRAAASSGETYEQVLTDGESRRLDMVKTGLWRTIAPTEPGHVHAWADVLNHQVRNSSVAMWFAKHPEGTLDDFETWLKDPLRQHLHDRLPYLAHDPEGWYHRVKPMVDDLLAGDDKLREAVLNGRVSTSRLAKIEMSQRPAVHGAALDYNTGRNRAARMIGDTMNSTMRFLAEMPTDRLSRQPFFNTIYKMEVRKMAGLRFKAVEGTGRQFTEDDLRYIERQARKKALAHVKNYLWDISAHSNAAHMLRFISPFFAAHQEALNRWWRIAKDDPSVVRRFQLAFDAPRHAGLTYDATTGEPIKPGESISSQHRILLRVPWLGDNATLNRWLRKLGGDKYWSVNENGLNTILQGGLTNPGTGPLVSLPAGIFARKYAKDPQILKAANILTSGYIPDSNVDALLPGSVAKFVALATKNGQYDSLMSQNIQDRLVTFMQKNGRTPSDAEFDGLTQLAGHDTNRDLWMMAGSNLLAFTPAKPNSKYALIQNGFNRIRQQAEAQGKDFLWMKQAFEKKYGSIYDALITSSSANPAALTGTPAEVAATQKYAGLIGRVDPLIAKMVIGPEAAGAKGAAGQYNPQARAALEGMQLTPGSTQTLIEARDPKTIALGSLVDQGWNQYDQLTTWLQNTARQQGLASFYDSPQLMDLYRSGKQQLFNTNFAFRNAWAQTTTSDQFDKYLDDMRQVASYKKLQDPARPDIAYLKQYLQVRDWVTQVLNARAAAGGSASPKSSANQPLMQFFSKYVIALTNQSSYFSNYDYNGIIEHDPYLLGVQ